MRINDLAGWPPKEFQCSEDPSVPYQPQHLGLRLQGVRFVAGSKNRQTPGDLVLTLIDQRKSEKCTARLKVLDADVGRVQAALEQCGGLTLEQAGLREIT